MKKLSLIFLLLLSVSFMDAQTYGYRGSRVAIKTDLMQIPLHLGFTVEGEFVVLRRISLTFEYGQGSYKGDFSKGYSYSGFFDLTRRSYEFGFKLYYGGSGAFQAPRGFYFNFRYGFGYVEGVGKHLDEKFALKNFPIHGGRIGVGYQFIFGRYIVVDPSVSITFSGLGAKVKNDSAYDEFRGFKTTYSGDLTGWGRESALGMGIAMQLRVGFLIPAFKKAKKPNYVI